MAGADLEHLLAWIGGGADGEALTAAREAVRRAPEPAREDLVNAVEAAATQLAVARGYLRRLVADGGDPGAAAFADAAGMLVRCREWMLTLIDEHRVGRPAALAGSGSGAATTR